jgi:endoglucanase
MSAGLLAAVVAGCGPAIGTLSAAGGGTTAKTAATTTTTTASNTLSGWLHTSGSKIEDAGNHVVTIRAVAWFGMETANCAPHGLWTINLDSALAQIRSFGFNAIRLPYANQCLNAGATTSGIDFNQNPQLAGKTPIQVMDAVVSSAAAHGLKVILDQHRPDTGAQRLEDARHPLPQ